MGYSYESQKIGHQNDFNRQDERLRRQGVTYGTVCKIALMGRKARGEIEVRNMKMSNPQETKKSYSERVKKIMVSVLLRRVRNFRCQRGPYMNSYWWCLPPQTQPAGDKDEVLYSSGSSIERRYRTQ